MELWLSAALMVVGLLLMVSYYYEDGGKIHFGGHFRDSSSGGGDILPPPGYHDDNDTITSNNSRPPYLRYLPPQRKFQIVVPGITEYFPAPFTGKCASKSNLWRSCDAPVCSRNHTHRLPNFRLPKTTRLGQPTVEFVHQVLRKAWGETPPAIDLFVRTGCGGTKELTYMLATLAIFYPKFLGHIIVVLDVNDQGKVDFVVPKPLLEGYAVKLVYEHQPCMLGRIFNQYSYLNLPAHTNAEFVVTIDSDCAFHRPVTPDVLFNHLGKLILPTNSGFQSTYWYPKQFHFTHIDDRAWGHSMVSQPVSFRVDTFTAYFAYIESNRGVCYEELLTKFYFDHMPNIYAFCWMCQLSAFVGQYDAGNHYDVHDTFRRSRDPYLRYASHVGYDLPSEATPYEVAVKRAVKQGLCLWFASEFEMCEKHNGVGFAKELLFTYAKFNLNTHSSPHQLDLALTMAQQRLNFYL
ncbi:hypothetical protein BASA82_000210 [Batrachochytrium salamandrivorans]|nr:hypothetical protein BASA82_000210 [Batrachochytrium salamandrivorans]